MPVMNVTPLVDVVLVLLIIFMVVLPAMQAGLNLELPKIVNVDDKKETRWIPSYFRSQKMAVYILKNKSSQQAIFALNWRMPIAESPIANLCCAPTAVWPIKMRVA